MNDMLFFGALVYLFVSTIVFATLPQEFYYDVEEIDTDTGQDLINTFNISAPESADVSEQISFIRTVALFFFAPFTFNSIPLFVGIVIFFLNMITTLIASVYIYDKIRGIGS